MINARSIAASILFVGFALPAAAGVNTPVHVTVDKTAHIADLLTLLSAKTGVPIISDDTMIDTIDIADIREPGLEPMFNALTVLDPGLTWQRIYLPRKGLLPDGDLLVKQIHALKPGVKAGIVFSGPPDNAATSFVKADRGSGIAPPNGMRVAYLVTNESVRRMRLTGKWSMRSGKQVAQTPLEQAMSGLESASAALKKMSPAEQQQTLAAMRQMLSQFDPTVLAQLLPQQPAAANTDNTYTVNNRIDDYLNSIGVEVNRRGAHHPGARQLPRRLRPLLRPP